MKRFKIRIEVDVVQEGNPLARMSEAGSGRGYTGKWLYQDELNVLEPPSHAIDNEDFEASQALFRTAAEMLSRRFVIEREDDES